MSEEVRNCKCCSRQLNVTKYVASTISPHEYAKARIDDRPVVVKIETYLPTKSFAFNRLRKVTLANEQLLINVIGNQRKTGTDILEYSRLRKNAGGQIIDYHRIQLEKIAKIEAENKKIFNQLQAIQPNSSVCRAKLAKAWRKHLKKIHQNGKYPYDECAKLQNGPPDDCYDQWMCLTRCPAASRSRVHFDFILPETGQSLGRVTFVLMDDLQSNTVEHFRNSVADKKLKKVIKLKRIYRDVYAEFDIPSANDFDGRVAQDDQMLSMNYPGTLATLPLDNNNHNSSQYILTLKSLAVLNGCCYVIGRMIRGWNVLRSLQTMATTSGRPKHHGDRVSIMIVNGCHSEDWIFAVSKFCINQLFMLLWETPNRENKNVR